MDTSLQITLHFRFIRAACCALALLAFGVNPACAGTTATLTVNGSAVDDCNAPAQTDAKAGINFAPFDPLSPSLIQAVGNFSVKCSNGTVVKVYLSPATGDRIMVGTTNPHNTLSYKIFESDYSTVYPTSIGTAVTAGTSTGKANAIPWALYGQLDNTANADAAVDSYSGSFIMNVAY